MENIISFKEKIMDRDFQNIRLSTNQSCTNFGGKKVISDIELKAIFKIIGNKLMDINFEYYTDVLPKYMMYIVNYSISEKIPLTKDLYIKKLDILKYYLKTVCDYDADNNFIEEYKQDLLKI